MKKYFLLLTMAITVVSVSAKKTIVADTLYVTTIPQMHCDNCENKIKNTFEQSKVFLRFGEGIFCEGRKGEPKDMRRGRAHQASDIAELWCEILSLQD